MNDWWTTVESWCDRLNDQLEATATEAIEGIGLWIEDVAEECDRAIVDWSTDLEHWQIEVEQELQDHWNWDIAQDREEWNALLDALYIPFFDLNLLGEWWLADRQDGSEAEWWGPMDQEWSAGSSDRADHIWEELNPKVEPATNRYPACLGCQHYHGRLYGGQILVCAMHPHGWDGEACPDWDGDRDDPAQLAPPH